MITRTLSPVPSRQSYLHLSFEFHDVILLLNYSTQKIHKRISPSLAETIRPHESKMAASGKVNDDDDDSPYFKTMSIKAT